MKKVEIKNVCGHYEAFIDGEFYCSGDTVDECIHDIEKEGILNCQNEE